MRVCSQSRLPFALFGFEAGFKDPCFLRTRVLEVGSTMDLWVLLNCQVAIGRAQDKAGRGIEEQTALAVYLCVSPNDLLYHLFACVCLQRVLDSLELEL